MDFIRSIVAEDESLAAGGTNTYDLPTNPVSHLVLTIRGLNVTNEASLADLMTRISDIVVTNRGATVFDMSLTDLVRMNAIMFGNHPILLNQVATDNATRAITVIVPFGRKIMNPDECFPASNRGEFRLQVTAESTTSEIDNLTVQVESVELLDASPNQFLKVSTSSLTPTSGVENDVDLATGNKYAGILLWGTTVPTGTAWTATIEKAKFLVNNIEKGYAATLWESLHGELLRYTGHLQQLDASADDDDLVNYALMDFGLDGRDDFLIDSGNASSVTLRIEAGDGNSLRAMPLEIVSI